MSLSIYRSKPLSNQYQLPLTLAELAHICGSDAVIGNPDKVITTICSVNNPQTDALTFIDNPKFLKQVTSDIDVAYLVKPDWQDTISLGIVHPNPTQAFRLILTAITRTDSPATISETAQISPNATIGSNVTIGHYSVIEDGVVLGDNCVIGNHTTIATDNVIASDTFIGNKVSIYHNCHIGHDCVIADGAVIGGQGFGFSFEGGNWHPIPQIGGVRIGNHTHIGNNTCIDRGAINDTVIGNNVIIDNLVHIAHNVVIGDGCAMAAEVGIAGSTTIGKHCLFGGQVGIVGHIDICDGVQVNGGARILQSIKESGAYAGAFTAMPVQKWNRASIYFKKIEQLFRREKN